MKHLLLGDEAIAQGAIDAGLSGVYAYPGTPSTEITEYIQLSEKRKAILLSGTIRCFRGIWTRFICQRCSALRPILNIA